MVERRIINKHDTPLGMVIQQITVATKLLTKCCNYNGNEYIEEYYKNLRKHLSQNTWYI